MKLVSLKCPNCGGKLEIDKDENIEKAYCIHCGYEFLIDKEEIEVHNHFYENKVNSVKPINKVTTSPPNVAAPFVSLILFICIAIAFVMFITSNDNSTYPNVVEEENIIWQRTTPESLPIIKFAEYVYNKPVESITKEEFSKIKYININSTNWTDHWVIEYSFEDYKNFPDDFEEHKETVVIYLEEEIAARDLECFTGLTALYMNYDSDIVENQEFMVNVFQDLTAFGSNGNNYLGELYFHDPSSIEILNTRLSYKEDLDILNKFPNLKQLEISSVGEDVEDFTVLANLKQLKKLKLLYSGKDLKWLNSLTNLKELHIDGTNVEDYSPFYSMSQIESLSIQSANELKSIDFVKNMPNLKEISISGEALLTIEPLRDKKSLTSFKFSTYNESTDISAIESLVSLKTLQLSRYSNTLKDFNNLKYLEDVTVDSRYTNYMAQNDSIKKLKVIHYDSIDDFDFSYFPQNLALQELNFISDGGDALNLTELNKLYNLKVLTLSGDITFFVSADELFSISNLEELSLQEVTLTGAMDNIDVPNLKELSFNECKYYTRENGSSDYYQIGEVDVFYEFFGKLTNLEIFNIPSAKITNIEFVKSMPNLRELNILDNYVTDISPLVGLENIETINCVKNSIVNLELLKKDIRVNKG